MELNEIAMSESGRRLSTKLFVEVNLRSFLANSSAKASTYSTPRQCRSIAALGAFVTTNVNWKLGNTHTSLSSSTNYKSTLFMRLERSFNIDFLSYYLI